jgi:hypothetical protein
VDNDELENARTEIHKAFMAHNPPVLSTTMTNSVNNEPTTINFEPFSKPVYTPKPEQENPLEGQRPGILEGIEHEWMNWSGLGANIKAYQKGQALKPDNSLYDNPSDDPIPDNWTPFQERDLYLNVSRNYWDLLSQSKSPKDLEARYRYARNEMAKEDYYNRGSIVQKIVSKSLGIPGGLVIDPYNLIPFAASMKYLKISQNFIIGAAKSIPTIAAIEGSKELVNFSQDPDTTLAEAGYNAIRDTLAGAFLIGGMEGLGRGWEGYKLYRVRQAANHNFNGIGAKFNLNEKGQIIGYKAEAMPNASLSAAEVTRAQEFYDSQFAKTGLFWFPKVTKLAGLASPIVRGLNSTYGAVRAITNRLVDHDINTIGGNKHVPDSTSFEKRLMAIEGDAATFGVKIEGLRKKYNGIDLTVDEEEALKKLNSNLNKKDPYDPASFGRRVAAAIITNSKTEGLEINEAKTMWDEFASKYWSRYQRAHGFREETLPLSTAEGYLTQVYNRSQMAADEEGFVSMVAQGLKEQDELILKLNAPLDELDSQIKAVKEDIFNGIDLEANRQALTSLRAQRRTEHDKLIATLRDNPHHNMLLRERNLLTSKEAEGLSNLLKPLEDLKKEHTKAKKEISALKKERSSLVRNLEAERKEGLDEDVLLKQHAEIKKRIDEIDQTLEERQVAADDIQNNVLDEQARLNELALNNDLPPNYFYRHHETGHVIFRNPKERPKFRPIHADDEERRLQGRALYTSIMNLSDDEVMGKQVQNFTGVMREDPTYSRSVMLPSELFLNNNFLVTDLGAIAHNYALGLGKASAMQESLAGLGIGRQGIEGAYEVLGKEFQQKQKTIEHLTGEKKAKALAKLTREFNKEKQFVTDLIDAMLGKNHDRKQIRQAAADIRNLAASTRLGFVPLTQVSDMMGNVFKHGIFRFIRDGFLPTLTTLNGMLKTKGAQDFRRIASEANLALEHFRGGMVKKFYGYDSYGELAPTNRFSAALEKASHLSGNLSGTNYIENMNQRMSASIAQSKILELMDKHLNGTLKKSERLELDRLGLNPDTWAKPFMDEFGRFGEKGIFGGYQSNFYNWENLEARVKMADSIHIATRNTIIRKGRADAPFFVNNSVLSLVTQFMGWGFAAFNRYTVPLLQRGEVNQIIGTMVIAMTASMEGVTRKLARGEEVDMDDENFIAEAFSNSAPFAMLYKSAMFANQFMDNDFLNSLQNDKQRHITQLGMVGGAGIGVINDYLRVIQMIGTQDFNKADISKAVRAIPGMQSWWMYQLNQKFIDAATEGLPAQRGSNR